MGFIPQPKREGASRAFLPSLRLSLPMFIYEPQTREWRAGSSRVGAVFERREREQKRSGGEGGGSANILVRRIKCSVAFACSFLLRNHWRLLQHLDRRSQAEQSKIAGIGIVCKSRSISRGGESERDGGPADTSQKKGFVARSATPALRWCTTSPSEHPQRRSARGSRA